jgi:hypothetical protein
MLFNLTRSPMIQFEPRVKTSLALPILTHSRNFLATSSQHSNMHALKSVNAKHMHYAKPHFINSMTKLNGIV